MPKANRMAYLDADHKFTLKEEPIPKPGPGQVLVQVKANGICGSDLHFWKEGRLGNYVVTRPYVPGHEASGVVAELGEGVGGFAAGDPVVIEPGIPCGRCRHCRDGRYNLCPDVVFLSAPPVNGTFCDFIAVRSDALHPLPAEMSFEQGALVAPGTSVNLQAPATDPTGYTFSQWTVNGAAQTAGQKAITFTITGDTTAAAQYNALVGRTDSLPANANTPMGRRTRRTRTAAAR